MNSKIGYFLFYIIFLNINIIFAQNEKYKITGRVLDISNNVPIEKASVYIIDLKNNSIKFNTKANLLGNFQILLDKGNYGLSIGSNNFEVDLIKIDYSKFRGNTLDLGDVLLRPLDLNQLDEVIITTKDFRIENRNNKRIYHIGNKLKDVAGSMSNLLSYLPSISVDIDGSVQLRGKNPVIQINGRKSNLSKSEVLQMLPSDLINRIEVITRPSIREDETEPVINIITDRKRKRLIGGINAAFGLPSSARGGLHLALNEEKLNGYGLYGIKRENNISSKKEESIRTFNNNEENLEVEINNNNTSSTNQFGELQYEYLPKDNNEFVGNVSVFNTNTSLSTIGARNFFSNDLEQTSQSNEFENDLFSVVTEHEYERKFNSKEGRLKIELEYEFESRKSSEMFIESTTSNNNTNAQSSNDQNSNNLELKSRYEWKLKNENYFFIGYRFDLSRLDQKQLFKSDLNNSLLLTNNILFSQFDNTFLIDYYKEKNSLSYSIGFKLVNTQRFLEDKDTNTMNSKSFLNLLPQISFEYEFGDNNEISLSYYRFLRQPRLGFLNNFNTSTDLQRIRIGNPELKPQSKQIVELEFFNEFEKFSLSTTLSANFIEDVIQYTSSFDEENNITITRPENIGRAWAYGIDFSYNINSPEWLNTMIKLNGEYGTISDEDIDDNDFYKINTSIINIIRLKSYRMELSWFYFPRSKINFQTFQKSIQYFKFGVSKRVFKNKGNLVLSVIDPFNSARIIQSIEESNFEYESILRPNRRRIFLSLFLRFSAKSKFRNTDKEKKEKGILD